MTLPRNKSYNNTFEENYIADAESYLLEDQEELTCNCIYGEFYQFQESNYAFFCESCKQGSYSFPQRDEQASMGCLVCPRGVTCNGGQNQIQVQEGYWSYTNFSKKGQGSIINETYLCSEVFTFTHDSLSTNICTDSSKCDWSPECAAQPQSRHLGGRWCCT